VILAKAGSAPRRKREPTTAAPPVAAPATPAEAADAPSSAAGSQIAVHHELPLDDSPPLSPETGDNDNEDHSQIALRQPGSNPPAPPRHVPIGAKLLAFILGTTALMLGGVGLILNVTFAQSFGRSALAAELLAVLGGVIDVMTIILPTVAENLWRQRQIPAALVAWVIWCGVLTMTLIAASGFAATNIGDTVQSRSNVSSERDGLTEKLGHLRQDRNAITEARAPAAIEALIQREQPRIPAANWKSSAGCTNVTLSAKVCDAMNALRQAKADAERRDQLDANITATATALAALPPVVSADPGADMAAKLINAATFGIINATPASIQQIRIAGLTFAPAVSGLLLMFAGLTWRPRREV
jgi:hypothetical protein